MSYLPVPLGPVDPSTSAMDWEPTRNTVKRKLNELSETSPVEDRPLSHIKRIKAFVRQLPYLPLRQLKAVPGRAKTMVQLTNEFVKYGKLCFSKAIWKHAAAALAYPISTQGLQARGPRPELWVPGAFPARPASAPVEHQRQLPPWELAAIATAKQIADEEAELRSRQHLATKLPPTSLRPQSQATTIPGAYSPPLTAISRQEKTATIPGAYYQPPTSPSRFVHRKLHASVNAPANESATTADAPDGIVTPELTSDEGSASDEEYSASDEEDSSPEPTMIRKDTCKAYLETVVPYREYLRLRDAGMTQFENGMEDAVMEDVITEDVVTEDIFTEDVVTEDVVMEDAPVVAIPRRLDRHPSRKFLGLTNNSNKLTTPRNIGIMHRGVGSRGIGGKKSKKSKKSVAWGWEDNSYFKFDDAPRYMNERESLVAPQGWNPWEGWLPAESPESDADTPQRIPNHPAEESPLANRGMEDSPLALKAQQAFFARPSDDSSSSGDATNRNASQPIPHPLAQNTLIASEGENTTPIREGVNTDTPQRSDDSVQGDQANPETPQPFSTVSAGRTPFPRRSGGNASHSEAADPNTPQRLPNHDAEETDVSDEDDEETSMLEVLDSFVNLTTSGEYGKRQDAKATALDLSPEVGKGAVDVLAKRRSERIRLGREDQIRKDAEEERRKAALLVVKPLSEEASRKLADAMAQPAGASITKLTMRKDLGTVIPQSRAEGTGLCNDEVVFQYIDYCAKAALQKIGHKQGTPPKFHTMSTHMYSDYREKGDMAKLVKWMKRPKVDGTKLLETELLFIPVNDAMHWTLLVISGRERTIRYYDSIGDKGEEKTAFALKLVEATLGKAYKAAEWKIVASRSARQTNGLDCGVFVCMNALALLRGQEPAGAFGSQHMKDARRQVAALLVQGSATGEFDVAVGAGVGAPASSST